MDLSVVIVNSRPHNHCDFDVFLYYFVQVKKCNFRRKSIDEEYTGAAKNPDKLAEPSDEALNEFDKLLRNF
jgi:hypothetical protein